MSDDVLKDYPVVRVHRWYNRLADASLARKINGRDPLSGRFLKTYVTNRVKDKEYSFPAPPYLISNHKVTAALAFHRRVFLTEEKARLGAGGATSRWAGLVPRLKDGRWNGASKISLYYESLVEIGSSFEIIRIQTSGTPEERDLFTSLRGFQLRSDIEVTGQAKGNLITVRFQKWEATALDRYDFNYDEYLTLPNPDFNSTDADAIKPDLESFRVYHKNAKRMVDAGLAAPFRVKVGPWTVTAPAVTGPADIDPAKPLR
ncbi:MAG: hypothetical protein QNJ40_20130 [Xanthomonadales bacterium]|nr:hypothetical protein [Xanthomonadales bacterium]